jgi:hypothetical protein
MRIEITSDNMGFNVRLSAADSRDFGHLLNLFKMCVADNCRSYSNRVWRVEKRAQGSLHTFIGMCEDAGAKVIQTTQPRPVVSLPQMVGEQKAAPAYLAVSDRDNGGEVLRYRAKCKAERKPAIVVTRHDAWASLRATVYGAALTDSAKRLAFDYLLAGSLSNSSVRVSNRELSASRLSFHLATEMAAWLAYHLSHSHNIIAGQLDGKEHSRLEAAKKPDGAVKMRQGQRRAA